MDDVGTVYVRSMWHCQQPDRVEGSVEGSGEGGVHLSMYSSANLNCLLHSSIFDAFLISLEFWVCAATSS